MCSWGAIYNNTAYALSVQTDLISRLQEQATTGSRINRASDAPSDAYRVLNLRQQAASTDSYSKNLQEVIRNLTSSQQSLQSVSTNLTRAQQLLTQAASGTYVGENRNAIAEEIDSLLEQVVLSANTQSVGRSLFGGSSTGMTPYEVTRTGGKITAVTYQGSSHDLPVPVAPGVQYSGMACGDDIFRVNKRGTPELALSTTGARLGTATPSARGDVWLQATHTATTFAAGSAVTAGASSVNGDTVLGDHSIIISAGAKTIQLDTGATVAFDGTETNLKLTNAAGAVAYVNMTAWTNQSGTFAVSGAGTLSIDGGATTTVLTSSDNLAVTDSRSGGILYVDTRAIASTGVDAIRMPGTYDVFDTLINIRDIMLHPEAAGLTTNQQSELLDKSIASLKEVMGSVTRNMTAMGGRLQSLDTLSTTLEDNKALFGEQADSIQQIDIAQVAIEITRSQNLYQMTLSTAAKLLNLSLMDYMNR